MTRLCCWAVLLLDRARGISRLTRAARNCCDREGITEETGCARTHHVGTRAAAGLHALLAQHLRVNGHGEGGWVHFQHNLPVEDAYGQSSCPDSSEHSGDQVRTGEALVGAHIHDRRAELSRGSRACGSRGTAACAPSCMREGRGSRYVILSAAQSAGMLAGFWASAHCDLGSF